MTALAIVVTVLFIVFVGWKSYKLGHQAGYFEGETDQRRIWLRRERELMGITGSPFSDSPSPSMSPSPSFSPSPSMSPSASPSASPELDDDDFPQPRRLSFWQELKQWILRKL